MTIRQYAKDQGFRIVGRLHRIPASALRQPDVPTWIDDAGNEYWRVIHPVTHQPAVCIVTADGAVI